MKKILILTAVLSVFFVCTAYSQDFSGLQLPSLGTLPENIKVNPYVQVGFQHVASNINLPVRPEGGTLGFLHIGDLNVEVQDANFWTGIAGVNVKFSEMFSLFTSAGGILGRQFIAPAEVPISLGEQFSASPTVDFSATNAEAWFIQTGASLGPVSFRTLLGPFWNRGRRSQDRVRASRKPDAARGSADQNLLSFHRDSDPGFRCYGDNRL